MEAQLLSVQKAQDEVKGLCDFTSHYFELHGVDTASRKWVDVKVRMEKTVELLDSIQDTIPKVQYWSLKGRALNILPDHSQEAEDYLSRAVKHDPSQVDTWNSLGESYWKVGKTRQAYDCFSGALTHSHNKESLRNLSMVLRQMGESSAEKEEHTKQSLDKAKEAVALDVKDGTSWMILGNAYLAVFFMTGQDSKVLTQCLSAYSHADKDPVTANSPDLHYNRATLYQYEEKYQDMLKELALAAVLDPGWETPKERIDSTWRYLTTMSNLISNKGKMKAKIMSNMMQALSSPDHYLDEEGSDRKTISLDGLSPGTNLKSTVVVGIAAIIPVKERVPYACVVLDRNSNCFGLTVYNLASTTNFKAGNVLSISDPVLCHATVDYNGEVVEFKSLQVTNPSKLLVNGHKLGPDKLALSSVSVTAFN